MRRTRLKAKMHKFGARFGFWQPAGLAGLRVTIKYLYTIKGRFFFPAEAKNY